MFGVIIVDDRPDVVECLAELVPWEQLECQVLGTATNGEKALGLVEEKAPEIVITDIRMPIMDGLQFVEKCRETGKNVRFIVLSGYDDFYYAQRSIRLGVDEYLLKPVKIDEICEAVRNITSRIKKEREKDAESEKLKRQLQQKEELLRDNFFWNMTAKAKEDDNSEIEEFFELLGLRIPVRNLRLALVEAVRFSKECMSDIRKELEQIMTGDYLYELFRCGDGKTAVLFSGKAEGDCYLEVFEELSRRLLKSRDIRLNIGISQKMETISLLPKAFEEAAESLSGGDSEERTGVHEYRKTNPKVQSYINYHNIEERLIHSVKTGDKKNMEAVLDEFFKCNKDVEPEHLKDGVQEIYMVVKHFTVPELEDSGEWKRLPGKTKELKQWLFEACQRMNRLRQENRVMGGYAEDVKYIIESRYSDNISLAFVSKVVGLTPAYLSALFKEKTGENFTEYLINVRVRKAKELLKERNMRIYEIAQAVGYTDVRYFGEIFKKRTGMTPKEYQDS